MARRTAVTLALFLGIAPLAMAAKKGDIVRKLNAADISAFVEGTPGAVVLYHGRGDKKRSDYTKEFTKFCEGTPSVRCGSFDVDSDYGSAATERKVLLGTPNAVYYDASGAEKGRLSGPQTASDLAEKAAQLYGGN